jgi:hypothetical protein
MVEIATTGGSMARGDFAQAQLNGDRFVESSLEHPDQLSAPPLAPTESAADSDILLQLEALARISNEASPQTDEVYGRLPNIVDSA